MTLFVREYEWMWNDLHLSLAECRVYAYIHGLTHGAKGGYDGSKRHLAELLGLDEKSVRNVLNTLTEKNLILCADSLWQSAELVRSSGADSVRENAEILRENADSVRSPHTTLYNYKQENKASMQTLFEKFWNFYSPAPEYNNRRAATQMLFEARSSAAQQAIVEAAQEGGGGHPGDQQNPYFFVVDFPEPQPTFLRGDEGGDIVQVRYNGAFKLCTRDTMELFGLEWVRDW